ncbi:MAG: hypothetical protein KDC38_03200 [Planctomycetes bacterium]|nr:hypothetical protein [Planctomycetota bacterium]
MMNVRRKAREEGSAMILVVIILLLILGMSAAATSVTTTNQRAAGESTRAMRSYYLADTGAQIGNFMIRASNGSMAATTVTETLGGGNVAIGITPLSATLYEVSSVGTVQDQSTTIQLHVELTSIFDMEGAIQVNFGDGVEVSASEISFQLNAASSISGLDHDASGTPLADQSNATYGIAMSPVPGNPDVDVFVDISGGADLEGSPDGTTSDATGQSELFENLVVHARNNADIFLTGSQLFNNTSIGTYGTAANPVLLHVSLGDNEQLHMNQNFAGYGTLVIEVDNATSVSSLYMEDSTYWYGLVVIQFKGDADIPGGALIEFDNYATIVGGLAANFVGEGVTYTGAGDVIDLGNGNPHVLYSSDVLSNVEGVDQVVDISTKVISYLHVH